MRSTGTGFHQPSLSLFRGVVDTAEKGAQPHEVTRACAERIKACRFERDSSRCSASPACATRRLGEERAYSTVRDLRTGQNSLHAAPRRMCGLMDGKLALAQSIR